MDFAPKVAPGGRPPQATLLRLRGAGIACVYVCCVCVCVCGEETLCVCVWRKARGREVNGEATKCNVLLDGLVLSLSVSVSLFLQVTHTHTQNAHT